MSSENRFQYHASPELRRLVDGALAGTLDRAEMARLEQYLEADAGAMQWYLDLAELEALLPLAAKRMTVPAEAIAPGRSISPRAARWLPWLAAAALVAVGTLLAWRPWNRGTPPAPGAPASVTASLDVQWVNQRPIRVAGQVPSRQKLVLGGGLLEVTHGSGARVLLEGPASYTVLNANSGKLEYGRLVASVPPEAKGFSVSTGQELVVDHGTEFAIALPRGGQPEVGVFRGEVELTSLDGKKSLAHLYTDHAVARQPGAGTEIASIPFEREKFIRNLPSREFPWDIKGVKANERHTFVFDVTGLVWEAGEYRVLFKWMEGRDALDLEEVALFHDGTKVASDIHRGSTGIWKNVSDNLYRLKVPPSVQVNGDGRWVLQVTCRPWIFRGAIPGSPADSRGILLFESGLALSATGKDFIGKWRYAHDGSLYVREFKADGSASLMKDGIPAPHWEDSRWRCQDGVLVLDIPQARVTEHHLLRDADTLLFTDREYRNAQRVRN